MSNNPKMAKGIPKGAELKDVISAIPRIISAIPKIPAKIRPITLSTSANKFHTAKNGHKNQDVFFSVGITF